MLRYMLFGSLIFASFSCKVKHAETVIIPSVPSESLITVKTEPEIQNTDVSELIESFSNNSTIGIPHKNKIEINNFRIAKGNLVIIKFYSLIDTKDWKLKQTFQFEKDDLLDCDPIVEDFNNDGLKDVTYVSNVAARSSNEVRNLFIYDKKRDEIIYMKNSEDYPNMVYNRKLDCIDAWLFSGTATTVFLRIEGDRLYEFASVSTGLERVTTVTNKDGQEKVISRKKMNEKDVYTRYINFNPPQAYR